MFGKIHLKTINRAFPVIRFIMQILMITESCLRGNKQTRELLFLRLYLRLIGIQHGCHPYFFSMPYIFREGRIVLGDYCSFGEFTKLWNMGDIEIGDDFMSAAGLSILTGSHDPDTMVPYTAPVKIGKRVWCGANVTILPGVSIGDDVTIGAGSIVNRSIPSGEIWAGIPAKKIGMISLANRHKNYFCVRKLVASSKMRCQL